MAVVRDVGADLLVRPLKCVTIRLFIPTGAHAECTILPMASGHMPNRRTLRLPGYDYSLPGAYFITICTQDRACVFGTVVDDTVHLNDLGRMVDATWTELPTHCQGLHLDQFTIMPNHLHAIAFLSGSSDQNHPSIDGRTQRSAPTVALPDIIRRFKTVTTSRVRHDVHNCGWHPSSGRLWQRNYYEHVIRNDDSLCRIRDYIANNPTSWALDRENPDAVPGPEAPREIAPPP